MKKQIDNINPSAKGPLFRRLMVEEDLGYLRDGNGIIGFEIDLSIEQELSGFLLVAIKKHTILAYRSDIGEEPRLILFPPIDKLFDTTFNMLDLNVIKTLYTNKTFRGKEIERGRFALSVKDLTPPEKDIDIPDSVSEQMVRQMESIKASSQPFTSESSSERVMQVDSQEPPVTEEMPIEAIESPVNNEPEFEDSPFDDGPNFDESQDFDNYESFDEPYDEPYEEPEPEPEPEPSPEKDTRSVELKAQTFERLADVGDYVHMKYKVPKSVTTQVVNKALQSDVVAKKQIDSKTLAVMLFCKLFDEGKV